MQSKNDENIRISKIERLLPTERSVLLDILKGNRRVLESKEFNSEAKIDVWKSIERDFNSHTGVVKRNVKQLKKFWENMTLKRKKKMKTTSNSEAESDISCMVQDPDYKAGNQQSPDCRDAVSGTRKRYPDYRVSKRNQYNGSSKNCSDGRHNSSYSVRNPVKNTIGVDDDVDLRPSDSNSKIMQIEVDDHQNYISFHFPVNNTSDKEDSIRGVNDDDDLRHIDTNTKIMQIEVEDHENALNSESDTVTYHPPVGIESVKMETIESLEFPFCKFANIPRKRKRKISKLAKKRRCRALQARKLVLSKAHNIQPGHIDDIESQRSPCNGQESNRNRVERFGPSINDSSDNDVIDTDLPYVYPVALTKIQIEDCH